MRPARDYAYFDHPTPLALAHRGGSTYEPNLGRENTVHAFREAVGLGYRYLETDVHATADGRLVAFHDELLDRVTDARGAIAGLPWAQVSQARIHGIDAVPLMDELFETFPEARFNIDVKAVARSPRSSRRSGDTTPSIGCASGPSATRGCAGCAARSARTSRPLRARSASPRSDCSRGRSPGSSTPLPRRCRSRSPTPSVRGR